MRIGFFLQIADRLRVHQPNYQARIHAKTLGGYRDAIFSMPATGANSPALYNDDVIVPTLGTRL